MRKASPRPAPGKVLLSADRIARRVRALAGEIAQATSGESVVLLGLMNGALFFMVDLLRALPAGVEVRCLSLHSYAGNKSSGKLIGLESLTSDFRGKHVIVVDDILETGLTLHSVAARVKTLGAKKVSGCVLLRKKCPRVHATRPRWIGFDIPDVFVIGYGLDCDGQGRSLPDIRVLPK